MLTFRYHLVTIVAVFLALAIGIVVGSTVVGPSVVESLRNQVEDVSDTLDERKAANAARADALWADVKAITPPTILFKGADSKILSMESAEATVAAMQNARLVVIPRATHNVHSDNPIDFARELDTFLTEVLPSR